MDAAAGLLPEAEAAIQDRRATRLCAAVKKVRTQGFRKGGGCRKMEMSQNENDPVRTPISGGGVSEDVTE